MSGVLAGTTRFAGQLGMLALPAALMDFLDTLAEAIWIYLLIIRILPASFQAQGTGAGSKEQGIMSKLPRQTGRGRSLRLERLEERRMLAADSGSTNDHSGYLEDGAISSAAQTSVQSVPGDATGDGRVDAADFGILSSSIGANNLQRTDGDFNEDGVVNAIDFGVFFASWTEQPLPDAGVTSLKLGGDLNGNGHVDAHDFGTMFGNFGKSGLSYAEGDVSGDGAIDAVDFRFIIEDWTGNTGSVTPASVEPNLFYWPDYTPAGQSQMLKLAPLFPDNIELSEVADWLEDNGWTREGPNAVLLGVGHWKEIQATELYRGADGLVTIESIADHILGGMKNWERARNWWAGYLQTIKNAGYEVNLVAMDIESGIPYRSTKYSPPDGPEIAMLDVINYLYSNQQWARGLPVLDLEALNIQNVYGYPDSREALVAWNHWVAEKNAEAWTEVFAETAKMVFPDVIVNNFDYSSYGEVPLLNNAGLLRANAAVDGNSAPVLYMHDNYGYETVEQALAAFDAASGASIEPHTVVPWIGGPHREGADGWHVTKENYEEFKSELLQRGVPYLLVF